METTNKDHNDPQNDLQNAEVAQRLLTGGGDEAEETEEETAEDVAERNSDWGHVDPAEGNSPFPDPNAPSAPGSAV